MPEETVLTTELAKAPHYNVGGIEVIDLIEDWGMGRGFRIGNAIKYVLRAPHKENYVTDLKKAYYYILRELTVTAAETEQSWITDSPLTKSYRAADISQSWSLDNWRMSFINSVYLAFHASNKSEYIRHIVEAIKSVSMQIDVAGGNPGVESLFSHEHDGEIPITLVTET